MGNFNSCLLPDTESRHGGANNIMSDVEVDSPVDEKDTNGSHEPVSPKKDEFSSRKRRESTAVDRDGIDKNTGHHTGQKDRSAKVSFVKSPESAQVGDDFDSDEDTFADADSDCEPNQFFLDEMLEDIHPERLSLLDYRKEKSKKDFSGLLDSSAEMDENDIEEDTDDEHKLLDSSTSGHDENAEDVTRRAKGLSLNADADCESTTDQSDDDEDSFGALPALNNNKGKGRPSMYGSSSSLGPGRPLLRQPSQKAVWGK